MSTMDII
jgi:succinyl-CoA synthetase beta subunit